MTIRSADFGERRAREAMSLLQKRCWVAVRAPGAEGSSLLTLVHRDGPRNALWAAWHEGEGQRGAAATSLCSAGASRSTSGRPALGVERDRTALEAGSRLPHGGGESRR